jgi:hypothetical protein
MAGSLKASLGSFLAEEVVAKGEGVLFTGASRLGVALVATMAKELAAWAGSLQQEAHVAPV